MRILPDDALEDIIAQAHLAGTNARRFDLARQEILAGNGHLLLQGVARELNHLHAVEQRPRDGVGAVGRGDEHDLRQIKGQVHVVIGKGVVLFRIQHLQQGRRGIAPVIFAHLVDFIEHKHRVIGLHRLEPLQNAARHSSDIGAAMTADFRLIAHAPQGESVELAPHGPGNGLAKRSFAHARRADKADDWPLGILVELAHGQKFEDAILDFLQAMVVFVQHLCCHL